MTDRGPFWNRLISHLSRRLSARLNGDVGANVRFGSQTDIGQVLVSAKKRSLDYTVSTETRKKESARSTGPTSPAQTSSP